MRALVRKGQFGCYAAARCAFAISRKDLDVSRTLISEQDIETGGSFSSWYSTDDSYEQSIVLNALIDHSLCSTTCVDREHDLEISLLRQYSTRPQESINREYKILCDEADYLLASLCAANKSDEGWKSEKDLFPERYPIVQRFWYVECFSTMVKMTLRCLTTDPTDSLSNGRDNEEYDNLVQYVRTFIETERARKVSSSSETLGEDAKIWSLLFKRVSLFTLSSSSVSTDNEAKSQSYSVKLLQFFVCFASALVLDEKHKMLGAVADDVGYDFYVQGALHLDDDDDNDAETIALFSSVLSRASLLASHLGAEKDGALLRICST